MHDPPDLTWVWKDPSTKAWVLVHEKKKRR